eukprot:3404767-Karenia_brevis.AAC.1
MAPAICLAGPPAVPERVYHTVPTTTGEMNSSNIRNGCKCIFTCQRWYHLRLSSANVWMKAWGDPSANT